MVEGPSPGPPRCLCSVIVEGAQVGVELAEHAVGVRVPDQKVEGHQRWVPETQRRPRFGIGLGTRRLPVGHDERAVCVMAGGPLP